MYVTIFSSECIEYNKHSQKHKVSLIPLLTEPKPIEIGSSDCSKNSVLPLIFGGSEAIMGEFPHMTAIGWTVYEDTIEWRCGGSIISEHFIMTAAHCVSHRWYEKYIKKSFLINI